MALTQKIICTLMVFGLGLQAETYFNIGVGLPLPVPAVTIGPYPPSYLDGYPGAYGYSGNYGYWGPNGGWWGPGYYGPSFSVGIGWTGSGRGNRNRCRKKSCGRTSSCRSRGRAR